MADQSFGVFETLTQYGALGVITLALGYALYYLLKRQIASEDKLKAELEELRKEMNTYLRNDNSTMKSTIENNTKAINDLKDMLYKRG
jgi:uncharacterized membrane-anchored protein YhcB (DUF1043 family)